MLDPDSYGSQRFGIQPLGSSSGAEVNSRSNIWSDQTPLPLLTPSASSPAFSDGEHFRVLAFPDSF